jgi:hypothetical protein
MLLQKILCNYFCRHIYPVHLLFYSFQQIKDVTFSYILKAINLEQRTNKWGFFPIYFLPVDILVLDLTVDGGSS